MVLTPVFFLVLCFVGAIYVSRLLSRTRHKASLKNSVEPGAADTARAALLQAVEKDPADHGSRISLAKSYMEGKNYEEAVQQLNNLMATAHGKQGFHEKEAGFLLGECYMKVKNYDEAYKLYSILRQSDPDNPLPYLQIARIEKEKGDLEKAVKYMMRASSLAPEEAEPAKELAILLYDSKRITDALPMFKTVLDRRPDDVESNYYLGQIYVNFQNYKAAYNHFLKSKNGGAYAAKSLIGIAGILRHFNKHEESLKVLEAVTKFSKLEKEELLEARYQLGETHLAVKDVQNAIAQWEKILSVVKDYRDVSSKIDKYEQMKTNSKLHAYMMSAYPEFVGLCEHAAKHFAKSVIVIRTEPQRDSSIEIYTQAVYREMSGPILFKFFRGTTNVGQLAVREFYEKLKEVKAKLGVCFTVSEYTEEALSFAMGRVLELHGRKELIALLAKK